MNTVFPMADAHCDFLYYAIREKFNILHPMPNQCVSLENLRKGGVALQTFAIWVDSNLRTPFVQQALVMADAYFRTLDSTDELVPFTADFTPQCGKIATVLTIEGGDAIGGSLENLRIFYRLGVRAMALTWNETNDLAAPAMRKGHKGLTEFGRKVIAEMNRIGMAIDVSHLGDAGIAEILDLSEQPIFASHSNARAVFEHRRSLCDEHIKEIARRGGVVGVNFYSKHLCHEGLASLRDVAAHLIHILEIGGENCPAIGSDFDGMVSYMPELQNSSMLPNLAEELLKEHVSESVVRKICYDNLANYYAKFCKGPGLARS